MPSAHPGASGEVVVNIAIDRHWTIEFVNAYVSASLAVNTLDKHRNTRYGQGVFEQKANRRAALRALERMRYLLTETSEWCPPDPHPCLASGVGVNLAYRCLTETSFQLYGASLMVVIHKQGRNLLARKRYALAAIEASIQTMKRMVKDDE